MIARIISYVCGAISAVFLIAIVLNNTIDHNLDFKTVITSMTVLLSLVTICITVENYRKTSENTKRSIEIASLSTITNITKEYAARINETPLPLENYDDIQLFLEKFNRLINVVGKRTPDLDGIDGFKDLCVPYFSMSIINELINLQSLKCLLEHNLLVYKTKQDLIMPNKEKEKLLSNLRMENRYAPSVLQEYQLICFVLGIEYSETAHIEIKVIMETYNIG